MRTFTANPNKPLVLGIRGENGAVRWQFPVVKKWTEDFGSGTFSLVHQRATDTAAYPCTITTDSDNVYWTISNADNAVVGDGEAQLIYTVGTTIAKTLKLQTVTFETLDDTEDPPEAWQSWVDEVIEAKEAIDDMSATASVDANTGTPEVTVTKSTVSGHENLDFAFKNLKGATGATGAKGDKGDTGATGAAAGFGTPTASVDANVGTPSVTITATGEDTAKVFNFEFKNLKGESGSAGTTDFEALSNRPSYNGTVMDGDTNIPEVKTALWDSKASGNHNHDSRYYTETETDTLLAAKESTANKVTSMSSESTDTEYPSAKAVYDAIDGLEAQDIYFDNDIKGVLNVTDVQSAIDELTDTTSSHSSQIANKVDKVTGKGLSTNDYDATEKGNVASNTSARHTHSNKSELDLFQTGDRTKLNGLCNITSIGDGLTLTSAGVLKVATPNTWEDIQEVTRRGIAPSVLIPGDSYPFTKDGVEITAKVMGFIENGRSGSIKIKDNNLQYGVIFQTADCLYNLQADNRQAFYAAPSGGLAAGACSFILGAHSWYSADVGKTFYFTLASAISEGAQFVFTQAYNATLEGATVNVFSSPTATTASQTFTLSSTEISGATILGTLNNAINTRLNSCQRALFGSNRWMTCAARQQLNSDEAAGSVWAPQTIWDRPPSWATSMKGFMNGLSSSFTDFVAECEIDTYRNTVCDGGGYDTTDDYFFLPGRMEVFMSSESSDDNGVAWSFYKNNSSSATPHTAADPVRIKSYNGSATYWWLRSPNVGRANNVRIVYPTGACDSGNAMYSYGVAPAFVIA